MGSVCHFNRACTWGSERERLSDRQGEREHCTDFRTHFLEAESAEIPAGSGTRANQLMSRTPWAGSNNLYCAAGPLEWLDISVYVYVGNGERDRPWALLHGAFRFSPTSCCQQVIFYRCVTCSHLSYCANHAGKTSVRFQVCTNFWSLEKCIDIHLHKILRLVYRFIFPKLKLFFIGKLLN